MSFDDWCEITLGTKIDVLTGFPFKSSEYSLDARAIRLLRGDNVVQGRLRWDNVKKWDKSKLVGLDDYYLRAGDVVLAMDRPWIEAGLKYSEIQEDDLPCLLVQRVACLRAKNGLDQGFLKFIVGSQMFTDYILSVQTGTSVPHISSAQIKGYKFVCPPLHTQRDIARTLGALDDKIELNRQMNRTLEAMAQAIFKSWFVDFDPVAAKAEGGKPYGMSEEVAALFPSEFVTINNVSIPLGWELIPLDEIAEFENGLALQKYRPEGDEHLPAIKIRELRQGFIDEKTEKASPNIKASFIIDDGDVVFSWSGSLMVDVWCGGIGALNQHLFKVTSNKFAKWFYYFWVNYYLPDFQDIAAGKATTMGHIQKHHLSSALVTVPTIEILDRANAMIEPLLDLLVANRIQNRSLASVRDTLLPKLLSGEIRLKQAEQLAEQHL